VQFVDANMGWAYTESNGLLVKTTDAGVAWQIRLSYGTTLRIQGIYFLNQNIGWLVGRTSSSGVVMKTTNGGAQWTDYGAGLLFSVADVKFADANNGWVLASGPAGKGMLHSTDGGAIWALTAEGVTNMNSMLFLDANNARAVGETDNIVLNQNYPNPFNSSTTITFSVPQSSFVTVKIYNAMG
jgi:photosystem II stability/assembly factor-like uncharacterized protein